MEPEVGDRVELVNSNSGIREDGAEEGQIFLLTYISSYPIYDEDDDEGSGRICDAVRESDGLEISGFYLRRYKKIGVMSNEDRMRIRKEQLANG